MGRLDELNLAVEDLSAELSRLSTLIAIHLTDGAAGDRRRLAKDTYISGVIPTDNGDTGYMIICTALVLMMTIPGLGLYYSGMVRVQNVLVTIMQSFCIACVITIVWLCWGYSLAFSPAGMPNENGAINHSSSIIGDGRRLWLWGMNMGSVHQNAPTIPESVYCTYELAFAIITAALICGSFADRMRFGPMLVFIVLWHTLVYCPIAHWNWHPDGFLQKAGSLDFAGGNVVHISSGVAGMMCTIVIGNRKGYGRERFEPHNTLLTYFGCGLLWVGWYGFNAGSANAANTLAGIAMLNTQLATATAALSWMGVEWISRRRPSLLGLLSGAVAGLVAVTPAAGHVDPTGSFFIGFISGPFCYYGAQFKHKMGFDDALDAFGIHAVGGICGGILIGFFATDQYDYRARGVFYGGGGLQLGLQFYSITVTAAWSGVVSYIILVIVDKMFGLQQMIVDDEAIEVDYSLHGEIMSRDDQAHVMNDKLDSSLHGAHYYDMPGDKMGEGGDGDAGDLDKSVHGNFYGEMKKDEEDDMAEYYKVNRSNRELGAAEP